MSLTPFPREFPRLAINTKGRAFGPAFRVYRESCMDTSRPRISTRFPTPCTRSPEHSGQTTKTRPGTLNSGSKPWTRIETGSHVLFMTLVSITMGAAQDRHNSPADPPHTKAYSIINPVPLLPQPNGSKQQGTWVLLFCVSQMQC